MTSLEKLCEIVSGDIDRLFLALDLKVKRGFRSYNGFCPHVSDNNHSLSIYLGKDNIYRWQCWTRGCNKLFYNTIIGLTQLALSVSKEGWSEPGDKIYPFGQVVEYLKELYGVSGKDLEVTLEYLEKKKFVRDTEYLLANGYKQLCTKEYYLSKVHIPSQYFIGRGFSEKILVEYSIGDYICYDKRAKLRGRALIPILDDNGEKIIGISGRSINEQHQPKWLHSQNFPSQCSLFNYWRAKEYIKKTKEAIICESPMDCIRLVEAGINNVCGLMGNYLSTAKQLKLDLLGTNTLVLALDNDNGGKEGSKRIIQDCKNFYNIKQIQLPDGKDPGDLEIKEIRNIFNE